MVSFLPLGSVPLPLYSACNLNCLLLHLPHSLSVQKLGYKIWLFFISLESGLPPLASAPFVAFHSPFVARSNTWIQNLIRHIRFAFKNLDTKSRLSFLRVYRHPLPSGPSYFFFPLRSIKLLWLSPNLHSCSLTSSVLVSDLKLGGSLVPAHRYLLKCVSPVAPAVSNPIVCICLERPRVVTHVSE